MSKKQIFERVGYFTLLSTMAIILILFSSDQISGGFNFTSFELIDFTQDNLINITLALSMLLILLSLIGFLATLICILLADFGIIKRKNSKEVLTKVIVAFAIISVVLSFIAYVCLIFKVTSMNREFSTQNKVTPSALIILMLSILNFVIAILLKIDNRFKSLNEEENS